MALRNQVTNLLVYIYLIILTPLELSRLILSILSYALPSARPVKEWSFNQAVRVRVVRMALTYFSLLRIGDRIELKPGREGHRFHTVQPASAKLYCGPANDDGIQPQVLGLTWTPSRPSAVSNDTTVVLHFHGGAFVIGVGRDHDSKFMATTLNRNLGASHVCMPQYRLSSHKGGRFPAQLQDAITSYLHLLNELHVPASQIILSGDSAGGNLALQLLRYLDQYGKELDIPSPGAVTLWSPWVDLGGALYRDVNTFQNRHTDYVTDMFGRWGASTVSGFGIIDPSGPWLSPLQHPFYLGSMPVWVQTGDREILFQDDVEFAERYKKRGAQVELVISRNCPHDIILLGKDIGFARQAQEAAEKAKLFLSRSTAMALQ